MRQTASILLLGMLVFNWFGYRIVSNWLQVRADAKLEARLDNNDYDNAQLIEVRVPLHLPYVSDWSHFERYDGEIEIKGVHYRYVKRKIEKGDLVLLCLPNTDKTHLQDARDDFFKLVNGLTPETSNSRSQSGNSGAFRNFMTDYWEQPMQWKIAGIDPLADNPHQQNSQLYTSWYSSTPEQPPEEPETSSC